MAVEPPERTVTGEVKGNSNKMMSEEELKCRADDGVGKEKSSLDIKGAHPTAPDGGWGWIVVLGALVIGLVSAGFTSLISVMYVEWISYFDVSASELSWIGFLFPGTAGFVSIVIGKIWSSCGIRCTAIFGGFLSAAGCLGGSFSTEPYHIAISIGLISGLGVGLCFISSMNMVAVYFDKRFGIANGIMFLGTSISQIGVPPLTRFLVSFYGWRGTLQITSAFMFHGVAAGCLMRPLKISAPKRNTGSAPSAVCENKGFEMNEVLEIDALPHLSTPLGTPVIQRRRMKNPYVETGADSTDIGVLRREAAVKTISGNVGSFRTRRGDHQSCDLEKRLMQLHSSAPEKDNNLLNSQSVSGGVSNIPVIKVEDYAIDDCDRDTSITTDETRGAVVESRNGSKTPGRCSKFCKDLGDMFGITLFRHEPLAILQNFSSTVVMIGTFPPVAHSMMLATTRGVPVSDAASLLSVLGVGGTVGRILSGFIVDKHIIGPHCYMTLTNILTTIPIAILPSVASNFSHAAVVLFFSGVGIGSTIVLRIVQAKKVVTPAFMSDNVRVVVFTTGLGMTVGAVLSGWLADISGSYSYSMYNSAAVLLFGAAINLTLSILSRRRRRMMDNLTLSPI